MSLKVSPDQMEDGPPKCPSCGLEMRLRTASKGPNAGGQFWGCRSYPKCQSILSLDAARGDFGDGVDTLPTGNDLPRPFLAAGITRQHRAVALDTVTLPRWLVKALARHTTDPFAAYAWRIDLPVNTRGCEVVHPALEAAYAFLLRGSLTSASHALASAVGLADPPDRDQLVRLRTSMPASFAPSTPLVCGDDVFDSDEEAAFHRAIVEEIRTQGLAIAGAPQVGFETLVPLHESEFVGCRVDFAFATADRRRFVIEIDGQQHAEEAEIDARRDAALRSAGIRVIRIPASAVRADAVTVARSALDEIAPECVRPSEAQLLQLQRLAQLQIAVLAAMRIGALESVGQVCVRVESAAGVDPLPPQAIRATLSDLEELLRDLTLARGAAPPELKLRHADADDACRVIFGSAGAPLDTSAIYVHDCLQIGHPLVNLGDAGVPTGAPIDRDAAQRLFERCYGFSDFRPGQFEAIERVVCGQDTLLLLPTGAGKSATYQFATLIRGGVCVVVDPLLSLMDDQIQNLREHGVDRSVQVSSQIAPEVRTRLVDLLCAGHVSFVFVSPERLQQEQFRRVLQIAAARRGMAVITIDEAHCVSQWGHDFRPAYLNVAQTIRDLSRSGAGTTPAVLAMTGTASYAVLRDIQRELDISDPAAQITPTNFDRPELRFEIIKCATSDKDTELAKLLIGMHKRFDTRDPGSFWYADRESPIAGLVFCPHVNGDHGTVAVANIVQRTLPGIRVGTHSGKAPKGHSADDWKQTKRTTAMRFKRDEVQMLACTNSFGMGIDKPNIRLTIHWGLPPSVESFYQEAGRAGRDRSESWCFLLFSDDDPDYSELRLAGRVSDPPALRHLHSDVDRQLWFHQNSFPDEVRERSQLIEFIDLVMSSAERVLAIPFGTESERGERERAVYRLLLIGIARDYTVDWRARHFLVKVDNLESATIVDRLSKYVRAFNAKRGDAIRAEMDRWIEHEDASALATARHAGAMLIEFTYDQIEGTRRRALAEMRRIASEHAGDADGCRRAMLAYLSTSAFSTMLQAVADDANGGLDLLPAILDRVESPLDADDLASQAGRLLGSIYDHPGLLVIHAVAVVVRQGPDTRASAQDIALALEHAERFELDPMDVIAALDRSFTSLAVTDQMQAEIVARLTDEEKDVDLARTHASRLAHSGCAAVSKAAFAYLMNGLSADTQRLLDTLSHVE